MISFEEIVRVADGQIVPDPFVNTKKNNLWNVLRQGETLFRLNTEAKET